MSPAIDWLARLRQATQDLADDPRDRHAALRRAQAMLGLGRHRLARRVLRDGLRRAPGDPRAWDLLAAAELHLDDPAAAAEAAARALAIEPDYCPARYNLACALARLGRLDEALDALAAAVALDADLAALARDDGDLAALRANPRFAALTAAAPADEQLDKGARHGPGPDAS